MKHNQKDRRSQVIKGAMPLENADGFGLGIQVFKIDSAALKADTSKKDKRMLIQNLQNPTFARKYEKPTETPEIKPIENIKLYRGKKNTDLGGSR